MDKMHVMIQLAKEVEDSQDGKKFVELVEERLGDIPDLRISACVNECIKTGRQDDDRKTKETSKP